ncbi:rifin [Plasmodium falciparum IGH-CR14]|uniref:Rifin n=1 Tax=Plasmodium falciparum IGH-CR14 TaxID=580059 RepID=A0A0L1I7K8_PLAFA|nr:rifin [Plasmodium falciparum IGH-CR14]
MYVHNKNKSYITPRHKPTPISRVLSECDLYISSCDNDPDMKSVKENFDRQTSQRFEEYEKRMIKNRKRCKEQCDKDIQEIIVKDKVEKSLSEKVEKGCLKCGCGLGGVAAGVGIIGAIAVNEWTKASLLDAAQKGIEAGIEAAIRGLEKIYVLSDFKLINWAAKINGTNFLKPNSLVEIVNEAYYKCIDVEAPTDSLFCGAMEGLGKRSITFPVETISPMAADAASAAGEAAKTVEKAQIASVNAESAHLYSAIGYSVTAILIIVLVMFNKCNLYILFF